MRSFLRTSRLLPDSPAVDDIFVFANFTQGNVLASSPHPAGPENTDTNYSPLWQISLVSWNPGTQPRARNLAGRHRECSVGRLCVRSENANYRRVLSDLHTRRRTASWSQNHGTTIESTTEITTVKMISGGSRLKLIQIDEEERCIYRKF